jgi:hypothetical protein
MTQAIRTKILSSKYLGFDYDGEKRQLRQKLSLYSSDEARGKNWRAFQNGWLA